MMWRHLHEFIEDRLADHTMSAMDKHRRLLRDAKNQTKKIKRGAYPTRMRKTNKEEDNSDSQTSDDEGKRVDPKLTERIRQAYLDSQKRHQALRCPLDVLEESDEKVFLATELVIRSDGCRIDVVNNLESSDILHARPEKVKCPTCQEICTWKEHANYCSVPPSKVPEAFHHPMWRYSITITIETCNLCLLWNSFIIFGLHF